MNHTSEPWELEVGETACFHQGNRVSIIKVDDEQEEEPSVVTVAEVWPADSDADVADGKRICECVNACAGIENPGEDIPKMRELLKDAADRLQDYCSESDRFRNDTLSRKIDEFLTNLGTA